MHLVLLTTCHNGSPGPTGWQGVHGRQVGSSNMKGLTLGPGVSKTGVGEATRWYLLATGCTGVVVDRVGAIGLPGKVCRPGVIHM